MKARVLNPVRNQIEMMYTDMESLLPDHHQARVVWDYVENMDLEELYGRIRSVEGKAGRPAIDPRILMGLWLLATIEGVGSARELEALSREDIGYRWMCGGVSVNYHTLADFRVAHVEVLDRLLTEGVGLLLHKGLVKMNRVSHDGMRTRASANKSSFKKQDKLSESLAEAEQQVHALKGEVGQNQEITKRREARRLRAAKERQETIRQALEELEEAKKSRRHGEKEKKQVSCSTTDPQARIMKMPQGGFAPAYNVQMTVDAETQVVVGADVTQEGTDGSQLKPAIEQLKRRYGKKPKQALVDGGYVNVEAIEQLEKDEIEIYAPPKKPTDPQRGRYQARDKDSPWVARWRVRMGSPEAQQIYRQRASTIECVNAQMRNRGLRGFVVRGLKKVKAVTLWFVLAHNLMKTVQLEMAEVA